MTFRRGDLAELAGLWNRVAPAEFSLDESTLRLHLSGCPVFDWGASDIRVEGGEVVGFCAIKRSAAGLYPGPDPDVAHISLIACRDAQVGVDLLATAKAVLRERGLYRLEFGRDSQHFFPGCPHSWPTLHDFLTIEGFEEGPEVHDLTADLQSYAPPCDVSAEVRRVQDSDIGSLREFLGREFPGRWAYDTTMKLERETSPSFVYGLFFEGICEGFAVTHDAESRLPLGGAVFRSTLGDDWCALGPIGVSKRVRGQGWGDQLLAGALIDLKARGKRTCRIDWTTLVDWYGRHGFVGERRYRAMTLHLDEAAAL